MRGDDITPHLAALKLLGGGKAYEAYLAWDDRLNAVVLVKIVRPDRVADEGVLRDLEREARLALGLVHPIIVRGFEADIEGARPYLELEYLEGPDLRRLMKAGRLEPGQIVPLAVHCSSALHYLAGKDIAHLDVKPANIIMGIPPRLVDLSLARSREQARRIRGMVGTRAYMAPEQCLPGERGEIGPPADMWGLGVTLYEAIVGRRPFSKGDRDAPEPERRYPQLIERPEVPRDVPAALLEPVLACLEEDPSARPSPGDFMGELDELMAHLPRRMVLSRRRARL